MKIRVAGEVFPSFNSTNGIAVDVYLSGCAREPKCRGCHNPLLWDFNYGKEFSIDEYVKIIQEKYRDADSITIMGGEPLNHPNIVEFLQACKTHLHTKTIWLYTSYELCDIPEEVLPFVNYIKTGRYDMSKKCYGRLGSKNQKIWKKRINEKNEPIFEELAWA